MTQIAKMRFISLTKPKERGMLVLHDDGTLQVVPSDELRDEMSRLEEVALHRAKTFGTGLGLGLIAAGILAVGAGWVVGRIFGKLGHTLSSPRPVDTVSLTRAESGGVHLRMRGANRLQVIQMGWNADEVLQAEVVAFLAKYDEMRQSTPNSH
jgi:hypothetical protein